MYKSTLCTVQTLNFWHGFYHPPPPENIELCIVKPVTETCRIFNLFITCVLSESLFLGIKKKLIIKSALYLCIYGTLKIHRSILPIINKIFRDYRSGCSRTYVDFEVDLSKSISSPIFGWYYLGNQTRTDA